MSRFNDAFRNWFADSRAVDADGAPLVLYHGTRVVFDRFETQDSRRPGFHFGSFEQARMRCGSARGRIVPVYLSVRRPARLRDNGAITAAQIRAARARGCDGVVYLNRYEGIPTERVQALAATGDLARLDDLSDRDFRRLVPEARDSWIVFLPTQIKSVFNPGSWNVDDPRPHDGEGPVPALRPEDAPVNGPVDVCRCAARHDAWAVLWAAVRNGLVEPRCA